MTAGDAAYLLQQMLWQVIKEVLRVRERHNDNIITSLEDKIGV